MENERFSFLESGNKKIIRVNLIGSVVDKYEVDGEKKYIFLTLDDGSGQVKLKAFGDDTEKLKNINHGQTIIIIGTLRYFNDEIYIFPEAVKEQDPRYLIVRKLELEKEEPVVSVPEKSYEIKDKIIELIKNSENEGGISTDMLITKLKEDSQKVKEEIQKFLEGGIIFEPRPGKLRWLG
jgi:RPA family protein